MSMNVLLTGASGFVGAAIRRQIMTDRQYSLSSAFRSAKIIPLADEKIFEISTLDSNTDWSASLKSANVVIHSAARVHMIHETSAEPLAEFRRINVEGTLNLAHQAAAMGVRRFIFLSSIKVNGEETSKYQKYHADDVVAPLDPYGISKAEAEEQLLALGRSTGMEIVIIRPVLVYGPGVRANFLSMMKWLDRGIVLPFGAISNSRSLVSIDNLISLVLTCVNHPLAANQKFLVSDDHDLSTTQLLTKLSHALGKESRLLPVPESVLIKLANFIGKKTVAQRICGSLVVDITKTREVLGWKPPVSIDEGLKSAAAYYLEQKAK